jgi:processive 1,2-diacylglycerol beta-glucosyltransferase
VLQRAVILSGSLGLGHDVVSEVLSASLAGLGWESRTLDCMSLLGPRAGRAGDWVFRRLMSRPGVFDGLHFAHLRAGSRLATAMDRAATPRLVSAVRGVLHDEPAGLVISVFAAGVPAAAELARSSPGLRTVVLCPDALPHATWVRDGIDLFLVTSAAAAAGVRRYAPGARVAVVPPPVRPAFFSPPPRLAARSSLGIPADARCVLLMGGGWGLGPVEGAARALADAGVHVLAVAGHNPRLAARLELLAATGSRVHPFGFTPRIAELMNASDLVVTVPGALTCGEARAAGRRLMLVDAMPGHGRENLQHELELGGAGACNPRPPEITASVLAALDQPGSAGPARTPGDWDQAFAAAMASVGVGEERRPGAATGTRAVTDEPAVTDGAAGPAVTGGPAVVAGPAVIDGHPHAHSARKVGYP